VSRGSQFFAEGSSHPCSYEFQRTSDQIAVGDRDRKAWAQESFNGTENGESDVRCSHESSRIISANLAQRLALLKYENNIE